MDRDGLLQSIAETGYNVGFGAKKHFATYDIVEKMPNFIGFVSLAVGILSLVFDELSAKVPSAALAIAGVAALYINLHEHRKSEYERAGKELTQIFNDLRALYRTVKAGSDVPTCEGQLRALQAQYAAASISKQIMLADWYAHYKFFAQHQIEWIDEQKKFTWRDKVPLALIVWLILVAAAGVVAAVTRG